MTDLVAWLREQIDADERAAQTALDLTPHYGWNPGADVADALGVPIHAELQAISRHIQRHDPAAVLAQCEAHTTLLDRHHLAHDPEHGDYCVGCGWNCLDRPYTRGSLDRCPTWRAIASAYRHRPGYREEWARV